MRKFSLYMQVDGELVLVKQVIAVDSADALKNNRINQSKTRAVVHELESIAGFGDIERDPQELIRERISQSLPIPQFME